MTDKNTYRTFYNAQEHSIFHDPRWLDVVCSEAWDVSLSYDAEGKVQGALPYYIEQKYGFTLLRQPLLTPYLGPIISYPRSQEKLSFRYRHDKRVIDDLVKGLPNFSVFNQRTHPGFSNGQPFHWNRYELMTNYTYRIDLTQAYKNIESAFEGKVRTDIRKAEKTLKIIETNDIQKFCHLDSLVYKHQKLQTPYSVANVSALNDVLSSTKNRTIFAAIDPSSRWHSAIFLVTQRQIVYTLIIASDPNLRKSGAIAFLISEVIKRQKSTHKMLDFCGSMEERFQRVFRSFGAKQHPYLRLRKKSGLLFKTISALTDKDA